MKITIEEGSRAAEILDVSSDTETLYRVALSEGDAEFLYVSPKEGVVEALVNRWLEFPSFSFGPLSFKAV